MSREVAGVADGAHSGGEEDDDEEEEGREPCIAGVERMEGRRRAGKAAAGRRDDTAASRTGTWASRKGARSAGGRAPEGGRGHGCGRVAAPP